MEWKGIETRVERMRNNGTIIVFNITDDKCSVNVRNHSFLFHDELKTLDSDSIFCLYPIILYIRMLIDKTKKKKLYLCVQIII